MSVSIRRFFPDDAAAAAVIWNQVVYDGAAFPQTEPLTEEAALTFFMDQSFTGLACDDASGEILGLYILHPNNVGRCCHICNASYAVNREFRGKGIGELLVCHCMGMGKQLGFRILQFNAVVASNSVALHLYEKLGFVRLGTIPGGFRTDDGNYEDIVPHYICL